MKKTTRLLACALASVGCISGLSACGQVIDEGVPDGRTEIKISLLSGGYGNDWLINLMDRANKSQEKYWFTKTGDNKYTGPEIATRLQGGIVEADIYIGDDEIDTLVKQGNQGYLEDLTSVWESCAPNETTKIKDKSLAGEAFVTRYSKDGALYALPYIYSLTGVIYDHDLFEMMEWLATDTSTANGLTKGADGVEGTYDDGLPVTYEDFKTLVEKIYTDNTVPFIRGDQLGWETLERRIEPIWASYVGIENYKVGITYNGTYTSSSGQTTEITPDTGYLTYTEELREGQAQATKFLNEIWMVDGMKYFYDQTGLSHTDAQAHYVFSHDSQKRVAMILEGDWWENEAKAAFAEDAHDNGEEWGYGKRDFRYMPLPAMDGQLEESNGKHYFGGGCEGAIFVYKQTDEEKKAAIFDFLRMYASEENCLNYTKCNGSIMPYEYTIDDELKGTLSKFTQNMLEVRSDPNTIIVDIASYTISAPFLSLPDRWENITVGGKSYPNPMNLFKETEATVAEYIQALCAKYDETNWSNVR